MENNNKQVEYTVKRRINSHGGITIPRFFREDLQLRTGDVVNITKTKDNSLRVTKAFQSCAFCGSTEKLRVIENGVICSTCFNSFKKVKVQ